MIAFLPQERAARAGGFREQMYSDENSKGTAAISKLKKGPLDEGRSPYSYHSVLCRLTVK